LTTEKSQMDPLTVEEALRKPNKEGLEESDRRRKRLTSVESNLDANNFTERKENLGYHVVTQNKKRQEKSCA